MDSEFFRTYIYGNFDNQTNQQRWWFMLELLALATGWDRIKCEIFLVAAQDMYHHPEKPNALKAEMEERVRRCKAEEAKKASKHGGQV